MSRKPRCECLARGTNRGAKTNAVPVQSAAGSRSVECLLARLAKLQAELAEDASATGDANCVADGAKDC